MGEMCSMRAPRCVERVVGGMATACWVAVASMPHGLDLAATGAGGIGVCCVECAAGAVMRSVLQRCVRQVGGICL